MKEYCVTCDQMKILEKQTDEAGLSYYQMMENAGTIATNRIVEISMTSPINDAQNRTQDVAQSGIRSDSPDGAGQQTVHMQEYGGDAGDFPDAAGQQEPAKRIYLTSLDRPVRAAVYCGKGNNGGDGFVVARLLRQRGWDVSVILVDGEPVTPDAITNYEKVRQMDIPVRQIGDASDGRADCVIDAIYGTGFRGSLRENARCAAAEIEAAHQAGARVFALDIPSGMGGDLTDGTQLDRNCVRADVTITFHAKKPVHLQRFASEYCGQIITADIGIIDEARDAYYTFGNFVEIVSRLRAPDGCPWDRKQTHETLKKYLIEETQEALDAIDNRDDENLCEELGDVMLQIVLHAQIGDEDGTFDIGDVLRGISEKMIRRHPWVFGDMEIDSAEEGSRLWEQIKKKEKEERSRNDK